jgi:hypothetical protein
MLQGLRNLKATDFIKAMKLDIPMYSPTTFLNSKFMKSLTFKPFTAILQRGFRQYGQPHEATLESMEEYTMDDGKELYSDFTNRLCLCDCEACSNRSPHPMFNCRNECEYTPELEEKEKLTLGLYKRCHCGCATCINCKI